MKTLKVRNGTGAVHPLDGLELRFTPLDARAGDMRYPRAGQVTIGWKGKRSRMTRRLELAEEPWVINDPVCDPRSIIRAALDLLIARSLVDAKQADQLFEQNEINDM